MFNESYIDITLDDRYITYTKNYKDNTYQIEYVDVIPEISFEDYLKKESGVDILGSIYNISEGSILINESLFRKKNKIIKSLYYENIKIDPNKRLICFNINSFNIRPYNESQHFNSYIPIFSFFLKQGHFGGRPQNINNYKFYRYFNLFRRRSKIENLDELLLKYFEINLKDNLQNLKNALLLIQETDIIKNKLAINFKDC